MNDTFLVASGACDGEKQLNGSRPAQCLSRKGGYVNLNQLPSVDPVGLEENNKGWKNITSVDASDPFKYAVRAPLQLRDQQVTFRQGIIDSGLQHTTSHIGLAETSTFLQSLKDTGLIGARSWGLNSGSQSYATPRDGSLVLGGFDQASIDGNFQFTHGERLLGLDAPFWSLGSTFKQELTPMSQISSRGAPSTDVHAPYVLPWQG